MLEAIAVSGGTFIVSAILEANLAQRINFPGIGILFAVVVMGGFILGAIKKGK